MQFSEPVYDVSDMVRDYHPDVLVGLIGLNDLLYGVQSPEQLTERWRSEITASRAIAPSTDFVLVPVPDTWYANVDDYNARLGALAAELDSVDSRVVVSASAGLVPATDTIDNSHPSANGEERIAATVSDSLAVAWPGEAVAQAPGHAGSRPGDGAGSPGRRDRGSHRRVLATARLRERRAGLGA